MARIQVFFLFAACSLVTVSCTHVSFYRGRAMLYRDGESVGIPAARQGRRNACALVCLEAVLEYWEAGMGREALKRLLGEMPVEGYTLGRLREAARLAGLEAFIVEGDIPFLREHTQAGRPVIVTLRHGASNHSVVVTRVEGDRAVIAMDPAPGDMLKILMPAFLERWERLGCPALLIAPVR